MASEIDICNLALSNVRAGGINSLDESSLPAQQCKLKYPILRDFLLSHVTWGFSHKLAVLQESTEEVFGWGKVYKYPNDCLYINRLVLDFERIDQQSVDHFAHHHDFALFPPDLRQQIEYRVYNIKGKRFIAANEADLRVDYRSKVEDPALFDPAFVQTLSHLLAAEVAIPIVGGEVGAALRKDSLNLYMAHLSNAIAHNKNEQHTPAPDSEFITTRR